MRWTELRSPVPWRAVFSDVRRVFCFLRISRTAPTRCRSIRRELTCAMRACWCAGVARSSCSRQMPRRRAAYTPSFVEAVRTQLAEIGLIVRVVPLRQGATPAQRASVLANADMARVGTSQGDVDDAVGFLLRLPYMPDPAAKRLDAIGALPTPRRAAAAARLARRLQQKAVYLGIADSATPELVLSATRMRDRPA